MTVAIALFNGEGEETLKELHSELAQLDAKIQAASPVAQTETKPPPAVGASGPPVSSTSDTAPAMPPPTWAADPYHRHQYRYWDGSKWTDYVADDGRESRDPPPPGSA
jgi:hypothetical protein